MTQNSATSSAPSASRDALELTALALAICGSLVVAASLAGAF